MYGPISTFAEQRRQDLMRQADQQRLIKEARGRKPAGNFYRLIRTALANRFTDLGEQLQETAAPVRANHSQIELDSGVFNAR